MYVLDESSAELYLAGELVASGTYRNIDSGRVLRLPEGGHLPASLDGKVACFRRIQETQGGVPRISAQFDTDSSETEASAEVVF